MRKDRASSGTWPPLKRILPRAENGRWLNAVPAEPCPVEVSRGDDERGGRFNPPGSFPVLYMAEDNPHCRSAIDELWQGRSPSALIRVSYVRLTRVLNLCDPEVREALGIRLAELTDPDDMSVSRAIGIAASRLGFDGIIYPRPSRPGARNLAVLLEHVHLHEGMPGQRRVV